MNSPSMNEATTTTMIEANTKIVALAPCLEKYTIGQSEDTQKKSEFVPSSDRAISSDSSTPPFPEMIETPAPENNAEIKSGIGFDRNSNKNREKLKDSVSARQKFIFAAPEISNTQDRTIFLARIEEYNKCEEWHNMALEIGSKNSDKTAKQASKQHHQTKEINNKLKLVSRIEFYLKQPKEIQNLILNKIHLISDSNFDLMMKLANIP
ncbi:MAG: hypothetical protein ACFBSE_09655, partial [Prochloraceae cyanobacterium]